MESFPFPSELPGSLPMVVCPVRGSLGGEVGNGDSEGGVPASPPL